MLEKLEPRTLFNGEADLTWGNDGIVYNGGGDDAALDSTGRIVFLGSGLIYSLVDSAGHDIGNGTLSSDPSRLESRIAFQPDGRFVVAGALGVRQYGADGSFIRQFSNTGGGHFANVASDEARFFDIVALPNGDVLVSGVTGTNLLDPQTAQIDFAGVERYSVNGVFQYAISDSGRDKIVALPDGRFLVGDLTGVKRYLGDGRLDSTFNNHAALRFGPGDQDVFKLMNSLAVDAVGRIYGYSLASGQYLVVRLTPDGQIDTSYGKQRFCQLRFFVAAPRRRRVPRRRPARRRAHGRRARRVRLHRGNDSFHRRLRHRAATPHAARGDGHSLRRQRQWKRPSPKRRRLLRQSARR
jgi:hypothetical protein